MSQYSYTKAFEWILNKKYRIGFHVLFWIVMYLDEFLALIGITEPFESDQIKYIIVGILLDMAMVYLNLYVFIPFLLLKNKVWQYILLTVLSVLIISYNSQILGPPCYECDELGFSLTDFIISAFIPTMTLLGTAIAVKIFKLFLQNQQQVTDLKRYGLETELAYLKDQINPHSLFNALNNIYVQSRKRPEEASESILLLSDLLRYQLYDCAKEKVYLKGEVDYLKNYLKLDKLRKNKAKITFDVTGDVNRKMVAPFIFLPFIENAVKHGASLDNESFISIQLNSTENSIHFIIENSIPTQKNNIPKGGIGLANVKRRLELLYPNKHQLEITDEGQLFKVDLHLQTTE